MTAPTDLVHGPAWSESGLDIAAGRYPLQVEGHVMQMVALLVPGVTTVTPHARYYALHGFIALETQRRHLDVAASLDLLRRCEVVLAATTLAHDGDHEHLPRPHGADPIAPALRKTGIVDVKTLSTPGKRAYGTAQRGYWGPYVGSELLLRILASGSQLVPGPRCERRPIADALEPILELADHDTLTVDALTNASELCICAAGHASDGAWLRRVLLRPPAVTDDTAVTSTDETRRATIQLLARVVAAGDVERFGTAFRDRVAFGSFVDDDGVAGNLPVAAPWQGSLLRHYSVGAWRRIWSWLVEQVTGLVPARTIVESFADAMDEGTVAEFVASLPPTVTGGGVRLPAEQEIRARDDLALPQRELAVLAVGARRLDELEGRVRDAFAGRAIELSPTWMARRLEDRGAQSLRDFGASLASDLLARARRVAMSKIERRNGGLWLPTRLRERGDFLWKTSDEGAGDVGLRIDQLGTVLAELDVFDRHAGVWHVTDLGAEIVA